MSQNSSAQNALGCARLIEMCNLVQGSHSLPAPGGGAICLGYVIDSNGNQQEFYSGFAYNCNDPGADPRTPKNPTNSNDNPANQCGSIIQVDNLALGENLPLIGTSSSLSYFSTRTVGRASDYTIEIPVRPNSIDPLQPSRVRVEIAGRSFSYTFAPDAVLPWRFIWDGLDQNGQPVLGSANATVTYLDDLLLDVPRTFFIGVGNWKAFSLGLGGLVLSDVHFYDANRSKLFMGNGDLRQVEALAMFQEASGALTEPSLTDPARFPNVYLVTSAAGSEAYVFALDGRHLQTRSTRTGALLKSILYTGDLKLDRVVDAFGNTTQITHPSATQVLITAPHGQVTTLTLNAQGLVTQVTDPGGRNWQFSFAANGLVESFTKPSGEIATFTFDTEGHLTRDASSAGSFWDIVYSLSEEARSVQMTSAEGRVHSYSVINIGGAGNFVRSEISPGGARTTTEYVLQALKAVIHPSFQISSSHIAPDPRFKYMSPIRSERSETTPAQILSSTQETHDATFDPANLLNLISRTVTQNIDGDSWVSAYSGANQTLNSVSPVGRTSAIVFNSLDQPVQSKVAGFLPVNYSYDALGRLSQMTQGTRSQSFVYGIDGFLNRQTNALGQTTQFTYTLSGQVASQILPDGRVIAFGYDAQGNLTSVTPPSRPAHLFTFNLFDLIASYLPPAISGPTGVTSYQYNRDRQMTKITRSDGTEVNFAYAPVSGLLSTTNAPEGNYQRTYNYANQLVSLSSPTAANLSWSYDGDLLKKQSLVSSGLSLDLQYSYQALKPISQNLSTSNGYSDSLPISYDRDRLVSQAGNLAINRDVQSGLITSTQLGNVREEYGYDAGFGEVASYRALNGASEIFKEAYIRDLLGRIASKTVTVSGVATTFNYSYDSSGRLISSSSDNITRTYSYDSNSNRQQVVETTASSTPTPTPNCVCEKPHDDHEHNPGSCHEKKHKHSNAEIVEFEKKHKPKCYLVVEDKPKHKKHHEHHRKIACDPNSGGGGGSTSTTIAGTYDAQDRVLTYGANSYTYNARGEIVVASSNGSSTTYDYDSMGALVRVVSGANTYDYKNDGLGRRVEVRLNGAIQKRYAYDEQSRLIAEMDASGAIKNRFVYGVQSHSPDYLIQNGVEYKIIHDQLGSVRLVVNAVTGAVASRIDYDEFGRITSSISPDFQPLGFAGGLRDQASNLIRFGVRDYDPEIGRWTSKDPILFRGGDTNLYGYVMADPINFVDPTGLFLSGEQIGGMIGGAIGGAIVGSWFPGVGPLAGAIGGATFGGVVGPHIGGLIPSAYGSVPPPRSESPLLPPPFQPPVQYGPPRCQ